MANSSLQKDLTLKAEIYAKANIPEYWIIDLGSQQLIVLREPQGDHYTQMQTLTTGIISPLAFPEIKVFLNLLLGKVNLTDQ